MSAGRWLCNDCGARFDAPDFALVVVTIPLEGITSDDDPTLPPGQVIKYFCPTCNSGNLVGSANPDPFAPKKAKRN